MSDTRLLVIEGGSGTGKSSLARSLQERLLPQQWLHFSVDTVLYCLPASILDRMNLRNDWSAVDARALTRSAYACLHSLLEQGNRVIFDCVVMTERSARGLVTALRLHTPVLIRLTCSWDEIERRTLARGDRTIEEAKRGFETSGVYLAADFEIDTTHRSSTEIAESLAPSLASFTTHDAWERNLARFQQQSMRQHNDA